MTSLLSALASRSKKWNQMLYLNMILKRLWVVPFMGHCECFHCLPRRIDIKRAMDLRVCILCLAPT